MTELWGNETSFVQSHKDQASLQKIYWEIIIKNRLTCPVIFAVVAVRIPFYLSHIVSAFHPTLHFLNPVFSSLLHVDVTTVN